ncbi:GAF and ANTAR domain-containing protein [Nocardioides marmoraquaticus]
MDHGVGEASDEVVKRLDALLRDGKGYEWTSADLQGVVDLGVQVLATCSSAGITVTTAAQVRTVATSDEVSRLGDELQTELGEGPCVTSAEDGRMVRVIDLADDPRWPRWRDRVLEALGVRSMLCLPLFDHDRHSGALNLYAMRPDAFNSRDVATAQALAASSALAVAASQKISQLERALDTRSIIGQAMGILMVTYRLDDKGAFDFLAKLSQTSNTRLAEVARRLVEHHNAGTLQAP